MAKEEPAGFEYVYKDLDNGWCFILIFFSIYRLQEYSHENLKKFFDQDAYLYPIE